MMGPMARSDVSDTITLQPDPGLVASLGANHSLESAIADLVDNSIDASAQHVRIRFLTRGGKLVVIEVVDDGRGMDSDGATSAMTLGYQRDYKEGSLGHFGLGLKASAFAHADTLTVWSEKYGATPVGRRLRRADFSRDFSCEILSADASIEHAKTRRAILPNDTGTIVSLSDVNSAFGGPSAIEAQTWMSTAVGSVKIHLGVVFHRLIEAKDVELSIVTADLDHVENAIPIPVRPIDPFGYSSPGFPGYPRTLVAKVEGSTPVKVHCHIWPAKSDLTGFRIGNRTGDQFQGFFIYRHNRLLQVGGWGTVTTSSVDRKLARVVLDDSTAVGRFLTMNSEKQGIRFEPPFTQALAAAASSDGLTTFESYLSDAESAYKAAQRRSRKRRPAIKPDKGFAPKLRHVIGSEFDFIQGKDPIEIRWKRLPDGEFLDIDFVSNTVWLNNRYRLMFVPQRGGMNDAPVLKALLYLLTRNIFEGQHLGSRDRDNILMWRTILGAAVLEEAALWQRQEEQS